MSSYNRVIVMGNLTRDVELNTTKNGKLVANIGLAMNERYTDSQGEPKEQVTFVDVTLWGKTAEIAKDYLRKGSPVMIEGRLKTESWETDGNKRSKLAIVADKLVLTGPSRASRAKVEVGEDEESPF